MQDFFSLGQTELSSRDKAIIHLGRKLIQELGLDQDVDTLGRWMAHYIAELIQDVKDANQEERSGKMQACSEAILSLWKHRHELPNGKRPFEEIEPILRSLESLDPEDSMPRYFRSVKNTAYDTSDQDEAMSWLNLIDGLDYSAKLLIRYCLTQAAQTALDKSAEWVALAEAAGMDNGIESFIIRVISDEDSLLKASDPGENERKRLQDRIDRLEVFLNLVTIKVSELKQQVQQAQANMGD